MSKVGLFGDFLLIRNSIGTLAIGLSETFLNPQQHSAPPSDSLVCPYPLPRSSRFTRTQHNNQQYQQPPNQPRSVRFYLQRRKRDSSVIVIGKCACKYFYRFVYYSNSLDEAAGKLKSLSTDELTAGGLVDAASPDGFFEQIDALLEGTDQEKERALKMLQDAKSKVMH